jgi:hypothetical protein
MSGESSHLVQIPLPKEIGNGQPINKDWFDGFLEELTEKFGGATSFLRASGQGLWQSGRGTKKDSIAVVEIMVKRLDNTFWRSLRERLERGLEQKEIVIRAKEITQL